MRLNFEQLGQVVGRIDTGSLADGVSRVSAGVDRNDYTQIVLVLDLGTMGGALDCQLLTSATNGSFAAASPTTEISIPDTGDDEVYVLRWDLKNATQLNKFVQVQVTSDGGAVVINGAMVFLFGPGDTNDIPAANATYVYNGNEAAAS